MLLLTLLDLQTVPKALWYICSRAITGATSSRHLISECALIVRMACMRIATMLGAGKKLVRHQNCLEHSRCSTVLIVQETGATYIVIVTYAYHFVWLQGSTAHPCNLTLQQRSRPGHRLQFAAVRMHVHHA